MPDHAKSGTTGNMVETSPTIVVMEFTLPDLMHALRDTMPGTPGSAF